MLRIRSSAAASCGPAMPCTPLSTLSYSRVWFSSMFRRAATRVLRQQQRASTTTSSPAGSSRFTAQKASKSQDPLMGSSSSSSAAGSSTLASRWKTLPSFSEFHAKVITKVQGTSNSGGSGGSTTGRASGWWWRRPIAFLLNNVGGIIAYEMLLESLVSGAFVGLLLNKLMW
ncbi:Hypothetical protein, putative [Bodo saltans]|uniref:Uncharacterized protein n=1 Tax=Bodo saltans TaxID=75058 RepID=A0A0S4JLD0_BODSA|nr:Hypothetical protein, putative [Bodo saltans]|eukprot:CUG90992.1 Hypothetical protein, putative [Bodo saltans]